MGGYGGIPFFPSEVSEMMGEVASQEVSGHAHTQVEATSISKIFIFRIDAEASL